MAKHRLTAAQAPLLRPRRPARGVPRAGRRARAPAARPAARRPVQRAAAPQLDGRARRAELLTSSLSRATRVFVALGRVRRVRAQLAALADDEPSWRKVGHGARAAPGGARPHFRRRRERRRRRRRRRRRGRPRGGRARRAPVFARGRSAGRCGSASPARDEFEAALRAGGACWPQRRRGVALDALPMAAPPASAPRARAPSLGGRTAPARCARFRAESRRERRAAVGGAHAYGLRRRARRFGLMVVHHALKGVYMTCRAPTCTSASSRYAVRSSLRALPETLTPGFRGDRCRNFYLNATRPSPTGGGCVRWNAAPAAKRRLRKAASRRTRCLRARTRRAGSAPGRVDEISAEPGRGADGSSRASAAAAPPPPPPPRWRHHLLRRRRRLGLLRRRRRNQGPPPPKPRRPH